MKKKLYICKLYDDILFDTQIFNNIRTTQFVATDIVDLKQQLVSIWSDPDCTDVIICIKEIDDHTLDIVLKCYDSSKTHMFNHIRVEYMSININVSSYHSRINTTTYVEYSSDKRSFEAGRMSTPSGYKSLLLS